MARRNPANAIHSSSVVILSVFQISSPSTKTAGPSSLAALNLLGGQLVALSQSLLQGHEEVAEASVAPHHGSRLLERGVDILETPMTREATQERSSATCSLADGLTRSNSKRGPVASS
jgi:hypothetical protein